MIQMTFIRKDQTSMRDASSHVAICLFDCLLKMIYTIFGCSSSPSYLGGYRVVCLYLNLHSFGCAQAAPSAHYFIFYNAKQMFIIISALLFIEYIHIYSFYCIVKQMQLTANHLAVMVTFDLNSEANKSITRLTMLLIEMIYQKNYVH